MSTIKSPTNLIRIGTLALALLAPSLINAATIIKADTTNALGIGTSWVGGTAPGASDVATWSGTYSADIATNTLRALLPGSPLSWQGINVGTLTGTALTTNTFSAALTNITAASQVGSNVTITTKANHGYNVGQTITIAGVTPAGYNGTFTIFGMSGNASLTYQTTPGLAAATGFGTVESAMYVGGAGAVVASSVLTNGTSGIDLSAASHSLVLNASAFALSGNQTWNVAAGRNLRFTAGYASGASAKAIVSGSEGVIDISGGGAVDLNQGGSGGFADPGGFTGYAGKWRVNSGATLRGLRNGGTAWGTNTAADAITLNGGTLAVGGIRGAVGDWTWNTPITLATATTSFIDEHNVSGGNVNGRFLKLNGPIAGSGNLTFKDTAAGADTSFGSTFTDPNRGFILTGTNTMSGTVTIGGPIENGIAGRLTPVRVGGIGGISTATTAGTEGTLGDASIVNNGWLTFAWTEAHSVTNPISGTGSLRIGSANLAGTENQNVIFVGAKTYTGDTLINRGTLTLDTTGSIANTPNIFLQPSPGFTATLDVSAVTGFTLGGSQKLVGTGTGISQSINGSLTAASGSVIVPGGSNTVGTLNFNNNLNLSGGGTVLIDANNTPANDLIVVGGDLNPSGVTTLQIVAPPLGLVGGTYTLLQVSGNLNGSTNNFAIAGLTSVGRGQTFQLVYDTLNKLVNLVVTGSPGTLVWQGDGTTNTWDNTITTNWLNGGLPDVFYTGDAVTFDDTGSNTPAINLVGNLTPGSVAVNAALDYTFGGAGGLSGPGTLTKSGMGMLTLRSTNTYLGLTTVSGGTLVVTNGNAIANTGTVQVDGGAEFRVNASETIGTVNAAAGSTVNAAIGTLSYTNGSILGTLTNSGTVVRSGTADTIFGQFTAPDALAFNGTLQLRGSTPSTSPGAMQAVTGRFWLHTPGGSQLLGTKFNLDTGLNATNAQDLIFGDWDATSGNRLLTLNALTGFGSVRMDAGDTGTRHLIVDQTTTTTFNGMLLTHASTDNPNLVRTLDFEKKGSGTLTMANTIGHQTQAAGGLATLTVKVTAGKLAFTGTNTYDGWTAIDPSATMELDGAGLLGNGNHVGIITNNGTLLISNAPAQTISGVMSGTGVLNKANTGVLTLSGVNTYSGATTVSGGSLIGVTTGSAASSAVTVNAGATNGVQVASPNGQWACAGLIYAAGATTADFNLGPNFASTTAAPMQVNGNLAFTGTPAVRIRGGIFAVGSYPLYKYTGTLSGTPPVAAASLPSGMTATITNNAGNQSIDLVVTVGNVLTWAVGDGAWDINSTANWKNTSAALVIYTNDQPAQFDDSASGTTPITVTLNTNVSPIAVIANNPTKDYVISGTGSITGSTALNKQGAGSLTLATANAHTGGTVLSEGRLNLANASALGATASALTIAGTSILDNTSGGALINAGNNPQNWNADFTFVGSNDLNLGAGVVTLGGNRQVTVSAGTLELGARISGTGYALTKAGAGTLSFASYNNSTLGTGTNLTINGGVVSFNNNYFGGSPFGYQALNVLVNGGGTLRIGGAHALGGVNATGYGTSWGQVVLAGGTLNMAFEQYLADGTTNGYGRLVLDGGSVIGTGDLRCTPPMATISTIAGSVPSVFANTGGISLSFGSLTLDVPRGTAAADLVISKIVSGAASLNTLTKSGTGIVLVTGTNTFSGATTVSAGTLGITTAHAGAGSFDVADGATLVVSNNNNGASAQMSTLTLGASGTATLEFAHVASTNVPVINAPNGLIVNGANTVKIADASGLTSVGVYPLVAYGAGLFGSVPALAPLPAGVVATLTNDTVNAWVALDVTAVPPTMNVNPTNITLTVSGSDLLLSWPASHTGWVLQSQTNSRSIGLTTPTNTWFDVSGSASTNQVTITPNKADPTVFYRLRLP